MEFSNDRHLHTVAIESGLNLLETFLDQELILTEPYEIRNTETSSTASRLSSKCMALDETHFNLLEKGVEMHNYSQPYLKIQNDLDI
ncbi:hypothetical protein T07_2838 [Trichinella nelsoni]|uniref:Uncharacterized protein n=1 Tax=Trichinella nelsoni TaxID=6336 RepID=A0A0V0RCY9_9BILA|nr:hypothetical protein T07_2838 [Trichinella nelsoni]